MKPLAKRIRDRRSTYWQRKCDELFLSQFRGQPCEVCGERGGTVGHHVVPKASCKANRLVHENIVVLCQTHHKFSRDMAPHSPNPLAVLRWWEWFKGHDSGRFLHALVHEKDAGKPDWKACHDVLKALFSWRAKIKEGIRASSGE